MEVHIFAGFCTVLFFLLVPCATAITTEIVDAAPQQVNETADFCATCVKVDTLCYNRSYLFELTAPFRTHVVIKKMAILRSKNVLFYSFEPRLDDPEYFKVAYVSLDSPLPVHPVIKPNNNETYNFSVLDINQRENKIYLGGSDGIWVINETNHFSYFVAKGDVITSVISKDYVYFAKKSFPGIIKNKNGEFDILLEDKTVEDFVLDKDVEYTIVYLHSTGLYAYNSRTKEDVRLSQNRFFRGLTVDLQGTVYAWYIDGIYKVTFDSVFARSRVSRVSNVVVGAMVFDNSNDIIYSLDKSLYKLTKTNTTNC